MVKQLMLFVGLMGYCTLLCSMDQIQGERLELAIDACYATMGLQSGASKKDVDEAYIYLNYTLYSADEYSEMLNAYNFLTANFKKQNPPVLKCP